MAEAEYIAPPELTVASIDEVHARMLSILPANIDRFEGGGAWDLTRPAAVEKYLLINDINVALQIMFPQYAYERWLDLHADSIGLERKATNAATGHVDVTGADGTLIPAGFLFATPIIYGEANLEYRVTQDTEIQEGRASVPVECATSGVTGNVDAHAVTLMVLPMRGIASVDNLNPLTGGVEAENDESLRERIFQRDNEADAAFTGSMADYRRWAMEVPGVGTAIVIPEWNGPGTVRVVVSDANSLPANEHILDAVYKHIMAPDYPYARLAPIGAAVTVSAPTALNVAVTANVLLSEGASIYAVRDEFERAAAAYFLDAATAGVVRYAHVSRLLVECAGVTDHFALALNGGEANITVPLGEHPVLAGLDGLVSA